MSSEAVQHTVPGAPELYSIWVPDDVEGAVIQHIELDNLVIYDLHIRSEDLNAACVEHLVAAGAPFFANTRMRDRYMEELQRLLRQGLQPHEARDAALALAPSDWNHDEPPARSRRLGIHEMSESAHRAARDAGWPAVLGGIAGLCEGMLLGRDTATFDLCLPNESGTEGVVLARVVVQRMGGAAEATLLDKPLTVKLPDDYTALVRSVRHWLSPPREP